MLQPTPNILSILLGISFLLAVILCTYAYIHECNSQVDSKAANLKFLLDAKFEVTRNYPLKKFSL